MTHTTTPDITLVLPLYNEGKALQKNLEAIFETLAHKGRFTFEMILIDDKSKDQTASIASQFAADHKEYCTFIQHVQNVGRGGTVSEGFMKGRGKIVGFMDVDCEASPIYILDFVPDLLRGGVDGITGLRIYPFSITTWLRAFMSVTYRTLVHRWLGVGYKDRQSGYKFFRKEKIVPLLPHVKDTHWFWDTEVMVVAYLAGLIIEERPILFFRDTSKKSTVKLFRDSVKMALALMRYRKRLPQVRIALRQLSSNASFHDTANG